MAILCPPMYSDFYPRPPRGGRPCSPSVSTVDGTISIHALREEGDHCFAHVPRFSVISIHALREEGDRRDYVDRVDAYQFLSTPSARRATLEFILTALPIIISIHALREEGDVFTGCF